MRLLFKMRPAADLPFHGAMEWETDRSPNISKMKPAFLMDGLRIVGFILTAVIVGFLLAAVNVLGQERAPQIESPKNTPVLNGMRKVTFPLACRPLPSTSGLLFPKFRVNCMRLGST